MIIGALGIVCSISLIGEAQAVLPNEEMGTGDCPGTTCVGNDGCLPLKQSEYIQWFSVPTGNNTSRNYICRKVFTLDNTQCIYRVLSTTTYTIDGCW